MTRFARLPFALALLPVAVGIAAAQTVRARQNIYLDPAIWLDVSCGVYTAVAPIIPATRDSAAVNLSNPFGCLLLLYPAGQTTRSAQALQIAAIGND